MAPTPARRLRLAAVDTNVVLHRAEDSAPAVNLILRLIRSGYTPAVTQTVIEELGYMAGHAPLPRKRAVAKLALQSMLEWGILPAQMKPAYNGVTEMTATILLSRGMIPEGEKNDALIVSECACCEALFLFTWDNHLLNAPLPRIQEFLKSKDLYPVDIARPELILNA